MKHAVLWLFVSLLFVGCDVLTFDNVPPEATFTHRLEGAALRVDASDSKDSDGTIASYSWDFGDGATATGKVANHIYTKSGTYTISLTVKDDKDAEDKATKTATVTVTSNQIPQAAFVYTTAALTVNVDASGSSDSDGTIASYSWDFGDGKTATGKTASHTYANAGAYSVKLTVKDDKGAEDSSTQRVSVSVPVNQVPQAIFVVKVTDLVVNVDASSSSDSDGTIVSYSWDFGDGATATGKTASHTYAKAGSYSIKLTVKDDKGEENSSSQTLTLSAANQAPEAAFTKVIENLVVKLDASSSSDSDGTIASYSWDFGDGNTATGKTVTHSYAAAGRPTIKLTVKDNQGAQDSVSQTITVSVPTNQAPEARFTIDRDDDELEVDVDASDSSDSDGTIVSYSWDFGDGNTATGKKVRYNYQTEGEYTITLTVKDDKGAEHQASQKIFLEKDDDGPAAKFTYIFLGRSVSVNGSHSNGNDGSIVSYEWDFGDGTKKTGVLSNHTYAEAGRYTIILTVTDRDGKKGRAGAIVNIR